MTRFYPAFAVVLIALFAAQQYRLSLDLQSDGAPKSDSIVDYKTARSVFWRDLYREGGQTLYCRQAFSGKHGKGINVEHVFPMSWVTRALNCGTRKQCRQRSKEFNIIEADLHNLYPARTDVNKDRSSFRFGEVAGEIRRYGQACDFEVDPLKRVAEPTPVVRGEVARAMFYMAHKYQDQGLTIFAKQGRVLQAWHTSDPPTKQERARNQNIQQLQGNRNPFIDKPAELIRMINDGFFY